MTKGGARHRERCRSTRSCHDRRPPRHDRRPGVPVRELEDEDAFLDSQADDMQGELDRPSSSNDETRSESSRPASGARGLAAIGLARARPADRALCRRSSTRRMPCISA